jgi:hypothetical protein
MTIRVDEVTLQQLKDYIALLANEGIENVSVELTEWAAGNIELAIADLVQHINALAANIPIGAQGERGEQGVPGERGEPGVQGIPGERGEQGIQGERGLQGERGEQGPQGVPGERGEPGLPGIPGPQGERGIQGIQGTQGLRGLQGERGPQGLQGPPGQAVMPQQFGTTNLCRYSLFADGTVMGGGIIASATSAITVTLPSNGRNFTFLQATGSRSEPSGSMTLPPLVTTHNLNTQTPTLNVLGASPASTPHNFTYTFYGRVAM